MKKKYSYLLAFLNILIFNVTVVHCQDVMFTGDVPWNTIRVKDHGILQNSLHFDNALYHDSLHVIPIFQDRVKVNAGEVQSLAIDFVAASYELVPDSIVLNSLLLQQLKDSISIRYFVGKERKENFVLFSFVPLRINKLTGKPERLKNFTLRFHSTENKFYSKMAVASGNFAAESVLASGSWYKCSVTQSGVFKLTYAQLKSLGLSKPEDVRIYGYGGKVLDEIYSGLCPDDLPEIPVVMEYGTDGLFNDGDDILFYAEGPVTWDYDALNMNYIHHIHPFSEEIIYFITEKAGGKRISTAPVPVADANIQVTSFDGLACYEKSNFNLLNSGRIWLSDKYATQSSYDYSFSFPGLIASEPIKVVADVYGRSSTTTNFQFTSNKQEISVATLSAIDVSSSTGDYAIRVPVSLSFQANASALTLSLNFFNNGNTDAVGYLDFIRITARQSLSYPSSQLLFRDSRSVNSGNIASFKVTGATSSMQIWDITNIHNVHHVSGAFLSNTFTYKALTDTLRTYIAFDPQSASSPKLLTAIGKVPNQNLHGLSVTPLIIITHPDFLVQAQKLADLHLRYDQMASILVTTDQVYNEFSSGMTDPAAIRNFVKMLYDKTTDKALIPRYLLLFGDGSYDNKNLTLSNGTKNSNYIVTYEGANSLSQVGSYVSDDYFGMLDDNENIETGMLDIGVGRLPVQNTVSSDGVDEAANVVAKIERYMSKSNLGDWHNTICFIGDAGDNNTHVTQADQLSTTVKNNFPDFNIKKVYVDAYPLESTSSGLLCPLANTAIADYLNKGLLVMNYTGHGGVNGLSKQQIMRKKEDIMVWKNTYLPLFMTATCELSRYDDADLITAGEEILLNPDGGGIALLTTTRLVYSEQNYDLNTQFYKYVFLQSAENPSFKLGDILRLTKNSTAMDVNKLNFTLLGDPALSLAIPKYKVVTDSINHVSVNVSDTLKAYGNVSLIGHITDNAGVAISNYNGIVYPIIYDKIKNVNTLGNFDGGVFDFELQDNILFRGKASVKNGKFALNFVMPRDIDYNFGNGKISYYVSDSTTDGAGYFNKVIIGGLESSIITGDTTGPAVKLYMNDTSFIDGGITDAYPTFLAKVADANGISPGGNSIGHDIMATLDSDTKSSITLNDYYVAEIDNFRKGTVAYKYNNLSAGRHTIGFKIWDIFNNSKQATINFTVVASDSPTIQNLYNYPNPFSDATTFFFEHNLSGESMETEIEIYNISGKKICTLSRSLTPAGYTSGPIEWDARDGSGNKIARGIYFYRVKLRYQSQEIISKTQKMIMIY